MLEGRPLAVGLDISTPKTCHSTNPDTLGCPPNPTLPAPPGRTESRLPGQGGFIPQPQTPFDFPTPTVPQRPPSFVLATHAVLPPPYPTPSCHAVACPACLPSAVVAFPARLPDRPPPRLRLGVG
jgi:hypothetical protein